MAIYAKVRRLGCGRGLSAAIGKITRPDGLSRNDQARLKEPLRRRWSYRRTPAPNKLDAGWWAGR